MRDVAVLVIGLGIGLAACGGRQQQATAEIQDFDCKERIVSYQATKHMGGDEIGVQMDCAEAGPRVKRWRVDKVGNRQEAARSMTPGEFDDAWIQVQGSGWENLHDCANGGGDHEPLYVFDVKDNQNEATFQCQAQQVPFPYSAMVDTLDGAAAKGQNQLGDDEPAELKELEKQQQQP